MRHVYIRLILGVLFLVCMCFSFFRGSIPFALLYLALALLFLLSARSLWNKHKKDGD